MKKLSFILIALFLLLSACSGSGNSFSLEGEWKLISYGDITNPIAALPDVETLINFNSGGQLNGDVGCNTFSANYQVENDIVIIQSIASTRMFCKDIGEQESMVLSILSNQTLLFNLNENQLTLTTQDGSSVIVLEKN